MTSVPVFLGKKKKSSSSSACPSAPWHLWRDTRVPKTTSSAPGVEGRPRGQTSAVGLSTPALPQLHFRGAPTLAQCGWAGKGPRKPPMSHKHPCLQGHPATAARQREHRAGTQRLQPGKLRVCFAVPAPSWSFGPTAEMGLHPAPCPQGEEFQLHSRVGSRGGFSAAQGWGLFPALGGGRGRAVFQPGEGW